MMKSKKLPFIIAAVLLNLFVLTAEAKVWRVNNLSDYNGTTLYGANFGGSSLNPIFKQPSQAAGSASVLAGDTIHLEGSTQVYDGVNLSKKLVIIGAGYFTELNPKSSANLLPTELGAISFEVGSQGSQLMGVTITGNLGIDIKTSNIVVKRCRINYTIGMIYNTTDISIIGNLFYGVGSGSAITIGNLGAPANVILDNNIFQKNVIVTAGNAIITFAECRNNVFEGPSLANAPSLRFNCAVFENNILKTTGASVNINNGSNQNVAYNFSASATGQFGTANGNQVVAVTTLFIDPSTAVSADAKYQLVPGSAVGSDGTERGAFGGAAIGNRYTLSGLAQIPVIYNITTSGVADASGLPVTIKARTIK